MISRKGMPFVLGLALFAGTVVPYVQAQDFNKQTKIKFSHAVEIPGQVLPAGSYTFTQSGSIGGRTVVQIWNEDKSNPITTVLAITNYRLKPARGTFIEFHERPTGSPQALKAWFYPNDNYGVEFVYPKQEALRIAQANNEDVPAETAEPTPSTLNTVTVVAVTPEQKEVPIEKAFQTTPAPAK